MRLSGKEAAPGPVEALKQMLFTMQDMAHHETLDNGDYYKVTPHLTNVKQTSKVCSTNSPLPSLRVQFCLHDKLYRIVCHSYYTTNRHEESTKEVIHAKSDSFVVTIQIPDYFILPAKSSLHIALGKERNIG